MAASFTCRAGHQWHLGDTDPSASRPAVVCPVCGAPPAPAAEEELEAIVARPPSARFAGDPAATIPAEDAPAAAPDGEPTIGGTAAVSEALRGAVPGYEILAEVGRGGMGVVYKARDVRLNRLVALKMILAGLHVGPRDLARFRAEAAAVAGLQHPNIVQIYEVGEHEGRPYLSLEYVEGGTLAQHMGMPLPPLWSAVLIETLARAVHHAHQRGVVHRDLKPANILLADAAAGPWPAAKDGSASSGSWKLDAGNWQPKLTDFGLAKQLATGNAVTQSGTVLGTPSYMAPEQALGKNRAIGPAADTYALGAILYEMLTGRPPFRAETSLDTMLQVVAEEPPPLSRLQPKVPRDLQTICLKCLAKEPHKRYATAEALADDLRRYLNREPIEARPVGAVERAYKWARRRPSLAALILLAFVSVVLAFAGLTTMWHAEAEQVKKLAEAQKETEAALAKAEVSLYCNRIALAEREWLANNLPRAKQLLAECPPGLRQWEWHYLNHLCRSELLTLRGSDSTVVGLAFDDQHRLAALTEAQTLRVWDTATGKALLNQRAGTLRDRSAVLAYGPGGKLHCASAAQPVRVWDAARRDKPEVRDWPRDDVAVVAFGADRRLIAAGLKDGSVKLYDQGAAREVFRAKGHAAAVCAVALSPGGRLLASGDVLGHILLWDAADGKVLERLPRQSGSVHVLAFSPDGRRLASAAGDPLVRLWESTTGNLLYTLRGHAQAVHALAFAPSGKYLASGGRDQMIKVWDAGAGEEAFTLRGHTNQVSSLAYSPDGKLLASAAKDQTVRVWDATTGQESRTVFAKFGTHAVAFRPDGKRLATAQGEVLVWDPATARQLRAFGGPNNLIEALAYSPDGRRLAVAGRGGLKIWDPATKEDLRTLGDPARYVRAVAYSPDGKRLAAAGTDGSVTLWDPHSGEEVGTLRGHTKAVTGVAFSPDGARLATASLDHDAKVWDVASGKELFVLRGPDAASSHAGPVNAVAFSPKGDLLATGAVSPGNPDTETQAEGELKVWDAATGELRHTRWGHTGEVTSLAFSPDGRRLASGSDDHTIKMWDPELGQEVLTLRGHTSTVQGVAFSPDGHSLFSTGSDQTIRIWNAAPLR